jgi:hypothetical protein
LADSSPALHDSPISSVFDREHDEREVCRKSRSTAAVPVSVPAPGDRECDEVRHTSGGLNALRTGTFQIADGQVLGQIVAYRGNPSWVFMTVDVPNYNGPVKCMLHADDGSTVAFGTFTVQGGTGQFSKSIGSVDVGHLRGAKIVTSTRSPVADAIFAA